MKKVLIFYASYGGGHLNAAKSINNHITENCPNVTVKLVDCVKYVNKAIDKLSTVAYKEAAKLAPWVWGRVYSDSKKGPLARLTSRSNKILAIKLLQLLREEEPDIIICTHPFASQMCTYLKRKNKITSTIATIMTDFAPHEQWLVGKDFTDFFFVAHDNMKHYLEEQNVESSKIYATGIPLSDRFLKKYDSNEIYTEFYLDPNKKTILFFAGGEFGLGKTKTFDMFKSLVVNCSDIQIIAVAGKNQKMKQLFDNIVFEYNAEKTVRVLSYTDKVPELMHISDLVITKPGGLTTTESLASSLPILVINPIPGQEEENAEFLEDNNVGIWIKNQTDIHLLINDLLNDPEKLEAMKNNAKALSKKTATNDICKLLLK